MKKKKMQKKIIAVVLLFTVLAVIMVTGTYAKFAKTISGSDTAVVAKFKVSSNLNTAAFDIFSTIYENAKTGEIDSDVASGKVAPGTEGKFDVTVQNDSEVAITYNIAMAEKEEGYDFPIVYSLDGSTYYSCSDFNAMFQKYESMRQLLPKSEEEKVTIYWKWDYDVIEEYIENSTLKITVSATFTQIDEVQKYELVIPNSEFSYGSYLNANGKRTEGKYGYLKATDNFFKVQDIYVEVEADDLTNYIATLALYDADKKYIGLYGANAPMDGGKITFTADQMTSSYSGMRFFRLNIGIYDPKTATYTPIPEDTIINVYSLSDYISMWKGKTINVLGDSITYGHGLSNRTAEVYTNLLAKSVGATVNNYGLSSSKVSEIADDTTESFVDRVGTMSTSADLIIVYGGTNDYWHKKTAIGTIDSQDTSTYYGALNYIYDTLQTNHSGKKYLFVFPPYQTHRGTLPTTDHGYGTLDDFRNAFLNFCNTKGVKGLDLATVSEFDSVEHTTDGVHPNAEGHKVIANAIKNYIDNNY